MEPTSVGQRGALYIGGEGVGLGYWSDESATTEKFSLHPTLGRLFQPGELVRPALFPCADSLRLPLSSCLSVLLIPLRCFPLLFHFGKRLLLWRTDAWTLLAARTCTLKRKATE